MANRNPAVAVGILRTTGNIKEVGRAGVFAVVVVHVGPDDSGGAADRDRDTE